MEPKSISSKGLDKIFDELKEGSESAIGSYLFKGYKVQVSKYQADGNERFYILYKSRRAKGLCVRCGERVKEKNPRTGKHYRLCEYHRELENRR